MNRRIGAVNIRYHVAINCKFILPPRIVFLSGDQMTFLWWDSLWLGHKVDLWCAGFLCWDLLILVHLSDLLFK
jgi:hypothetical protein